VCDTDRLSSDPASGGADQWLEVCRVNGIDPQEVRLIYARYAAYRGFNEAKTGSSIPLAQWFSFYRLEKGSAGLQVEVPAEGCSADGDAVNDACLQRPAAFLEALKAYDGSSRRQS